MKKKSFKFKRSKKQNPKNFRSHKRKTIKIFIIFALFISYLLIFTLILDVNPIFYIIQKFQNNNESKERYFLCSTYNNEAETIYIHLWRLYDYVDKFIIVISNKTHAGLPRNNTFKSFEKDIQRYMDKVDLVDFDNVCQSKDYPNDNFIWCFEKSQRDYAKTYIESKYNPTDKDIILIVDIDEILTREGIQYIKKHPPIDHYCIKGSKYFPYYYHKIQEWDWPAAARYNKSMKPLSYYKGKTRHMLLTYDYNPSKPLVTHCSYCFKDIAEYKNKIISYAHQEFNRPPWITNNWIFKSQYCRHKLDAITAGYDEPYEGWRHLIPDDKRLKYLMDPTYTYNISETTYTEKDLETLCRYKFNRTPLE